MERTKIILTLYSLAACANLAAYIFDTPVLITYSKPLLMPLLLYYVYEKSAGHVTGKTLLLAGALIFSWGGDIALMYGDSYFLPGVGSFLVAQIIYVSLFTKTTDQPIQFAFVKVVPFVVYGVVLFYFLLPAAGSLMIPVLVYGCSVLVMVSMARLREGLTSSRSYSFVFYGAVLFTLSDSIIGYNKFVESVTGGHLLIMTTYIVAQYMITEGVLGHTRQSA